MATVPHLVRTKRAPELSQLYGFGLLAVDALQLPWAARRCRKVARDSDGDDAVTSTAPRICQADGAGDAVPGLQLVMEVEDANHGTPTLWHYVCPHKVEAGQWVMIDPEGRLTSDPQAGERLVVGATGDQANVPARRTDDAGMDLVAGASEKRSSDTRYGSDWLTGDDRSDRCGVDVRRPWLSEIRSGSGHQFGAEHGACTDRSDGWPGADLWRRTWSGMLEVHATSVEFTRTEMEAIEGRRMQRSELLDTKVEPGRPRPLFRDQHLKLGTPALDRKLLGSNTPPTIMTSLRR